MTRFLDRLTSTRLSGRVAYVSTAVRVVTGVLFITFSAGKFVDHMSEVTDFHHYGVPAAAVAVYLVGVLELMGGILLVVGLFTRIAAFFLALNMIGAIATAGRVDGGTFHLGVAPTLLVAMLFLLWAGPGAFALDGKLAGSGTDHAPDAPAALPD